MARARTPQALVDALEGVSALDAPGQAIGKAVRGRLKAGAGKDALSGTWFGHPVHPPLTDVVIGSFLGAALLDVLARRSGRASERLLQVGVLAALPTALTGASDWADSETADARVRRVGLVHAAANTTSLMLATASLRARRRGANASGRALSLLGLGALSVGGFLGGHLSYTRAVGPNQTAFDPGPTEWTEVATAADLREGEPVAVVAEETPVMLVRVGQSIHALHDRCAHRGCSLSKGALGGHVVTCPCHGSQYDIRDGAVLRGPTTSQQPVLEVREDGGKVLVRLPEAP